MHFRSNLSHLGLAKRRQRISIPWMFNSHAEYLNEPVLSLYVCRHNETSLIPFSSTSSPRHCRRNPCQQHYQPIVGKSPWDFSISWIWRSRKAPPAPRRSSSGASSSGCWHAQVPALNESRLGGTWSWVVSAHRSQQCCLYGGWPLLQVLPRETSNRKR